MDNQIAERITEQVTVPHGAVKVRVFHITKEADTMPPCTVGRILILLH